jgi:hypothetical protein
MTRREQCESRTARPSTTGRRSTSFATIFGPGTSSRLSNSVSHRRHLPGPRTASSEHDPEQQFSWAARNGRPRLVSAHRGRDQGRQLQAEGERDCGAAEVCARIVTTKRAGLLTSSRSGKFSFMRMPCAEQCNARCASQFHGCELAVKTWFCGAEATQGDHDHSFWPALARIISS